MTQRGALLLGQTRSTKLKKERRSQDTYLIHMSRTFSMQKILREVRIRFFWVVVSFALTWMIAYCFVEEAIFILAKPFLKLPTNGPMEAHFLATQLTETLYTNLAVASIVACAFVFPLVSHQVWSFLIPSCYQGQRKRVRRILYVSASCFLVVLCFTHYTIVPQLWQWLTQVTGNSSIVIELQPKIYDYILFTLRILLVAGLASQVPMVLIYLTSAMSIERVTKTRRFWLLLVFLSSSLLAPPDLGCQLLIFFLLTVIIELSLFTVLLFEVERGASR